MGKVKNLFTSGKMNKDFDERLVPKGEYRDALNVKVANSDGSGVGAIENALSNEALSSSSFGSNASCIGAIADDKNRKIYWFVKSDSGSYLMEYSKDNGDVDFVLTDTRPEGSNVLNFSKANLITGVNVFIDNDNDKVFIYWTDNLNPPRRVEIAKAKGYGVNGFSDADISVIKAAPRKEPSIEGVLVDEFTSDKNLIEDKFFSFAYRYRYEDNQYSAMSPFSEFAFKPGDTDIDFLDTTTESMKNSFVSVNVTVDTGDSSVIGVDILAKESNGANVFVVHKIDKQKENVQDNVQYPFIFKNNGLYSVLSEDEFNRVYDNVPLKALAQEFIGNRVVYGNYVENYNLKDQNNNDINFDITTSLVSESLEPSCATSTSYTIRKVGAGADLSYKRCGEAQWTVLDIEQGESVEVCASELSNISTNTSVYSVTDNGDCEAFEGEKTLKSNRSYDVGIVYFDAYGRKTPVLNSSTSSLFIEHAKAEFSNKIRASINFNPPSWADRYKFAVKQNNPVFDVIRTRGPLYKVTEDSAKYVYIAMPQLELNKIVEGGVLVLKNNGVENINSINKFNVISIEEKEADWNDSSGEAGTYVKLEGPRELFEDSTYTIPTTDKDVIFETYSVIETESSYYEIPGTYDIVDGFHAGSEQDQTATQPAEVILQAHNAYTFGNGVESIKIDDDPNKNSIVIGVRINATLDTYGQNKRIASLTYSDAYDSTTNYNGLNRFNLSLANYKDMDASSGEIKKIYSLNNDLTVFQENKVYKVLFDKSVIYNADGTGNVSQNVNILGQQVPYNGEYGISSSPASFQSWGYTMYFADERRGAICRLNDNGIFEISDYGMHDWFVDNLTNASDVSIISGYDPINDHYVVSLKNGFIEWREDEYSCEGGLTEWREDTYTCQQESDPTTTTTTAAPTTSTTTVATTTTDAPTTSTTTAATTTTQAPDPTTTTTTSGGPTTTTTTVATTTSTTIPTTPPPTSTTITPVYYSLERCSDGSVGFRTGQQIGDISLSVNDRVEVSSLFYIVTGTTTSGTSVGTVTDTGLTGCPVVTTSTTSTSTTIPTTPPPTTTSTTVVSYNYYAVRGCPGSFYENRDMYIRTTSTLPDANGNPSTSSSISWNGQSFYAYSTISESAWTSGSGDLASITYTGSVGTGCPAATTTTSAPTTSAPTTQPPATTTTQPITTQAPTTTTVAPTTSAPTTTSTTAAPTTTTTSTTTPPATTTTQAPVTTTTAAPTTTTTTVVTTTTAAPVVYEVAVTSGQSTSDDSCNLFAFTPLWSVAPTPEDATRYYTDSGLNNEFNGGDQWYGFDLDGNGVTISARITSFGYLYSTTQCTGGGGFP